MCACWLMARVFRLRVIFHCRMWFTGPSSAISYLALSICLVWFMRCCLFEIVSMSSIAARSATKSLPILFAQTLVSVECCVKPLAARRFSKPSVNILQACLLPWRLPVALPIALGCLHYPLNRGGWWMHSAIFGSACSWRNADLMSMRSAQQLFVAAIASGALNASLSTTFVVMLSGL